MKGKLFLVGVILTVLLVIISCSKSQRVVFTGDAVQNNVQQSKGLGTILFSISANADVLSVSELKIKINSIELTRNGGIPLLIKNLDNYFNLVELRNSLERKNIGQIRAEEGKYTKLKINYELENNYPTPSNIIELPLLIDVKKDYFSIVDLNFIIDSSLRSTLDGQKIFAPVLNLKLSSAKIVDLSSDRTFSTENEVQTDKSKYGMTLNGVMVAGEGIWKETPLKIKNNKIVQVDVQPSFSQQEIKQPKEIKLSINKEFLNPSKFSVKVNETTKLILSTVRDNYELSIEGYGLTFYATPTENAEYIITPKNKGAFIIKCTSCSGKVIGQMDVVG